MNNYIEILKKLNKKAIKNGDIPVSAIVFKNNNVISKAYNKKYKNNDPLGHAEILAIKKACKKLNRVNLNDCELLVSLKPCEMCNELIKECRIKKVYYIADQMKEINDTINYINLDDGKAYFSKELSDFFKNKR